MEPEYSFDDLLRVGAENSRLKAEVERLTQWQAVHSIANGCNSRTAEFLGAEVDRLKAELIAVRKAGGQPLDDTNTESQWVAIYEAKREWAAAQLMERVEKLKAERDARPSPEVVTLVRGALEAVRQFAEDRWLKESVARLVHEALEKLPKETP
jgi:hypothetical protein